MGERASLATRRVYAPRELLAREPKSAGDDVETFFARHLVTPSIAIGFVARRRCHNIVAPGTSRVARLWSQTGRPLPLLRD